MEKKLLFVSNFDRIYYEKKCPYQKSSICVPYKCMNAISCKDYFNLYKSCPVFFNRSSFTCETDCVGNNKLYEFFYYACTMHHKKELERKLLFFSYKDMKTYKKKCPYQNGILCLKDECMMSISCKQYFKLYNRCPNPDKIHSICDDSYCGKESKLCACYI